MSLNNKKLKGLFLTFIFFSLLINVATANAGEVIQVNHPKIRLSIPPGSAKTGVIKIDNPSEQPKKVRVYLEDWVYLPACDGTKEFKPAGTTEFSAASWISFFPSEFDIPAYGSQTLNYTVKVPQDARGGHYAVLFFENYLSPQKVPQEGVSVNVAVRVASLFYIEPEGTINRQAVITDLKIKKEDDAYVITARFNNTGNVDITANGTFFILDSKGMVYARGEFNDIYTFAGNSALLSSSWKEPLTEGTYDLVLSVDIGRALEELNLGRGPVITLEGKLTIGKNGEILYVGELR